MANERSWDSLGPLTFTQNGGADGTITVASTSGLRVKQEVIVSATSQPTLNKLEIKKVLSATKFIVGPIVTTGKFMSRQDFTAYTLANNATVKVIEQDKKTPRPEDILKAVYEQEPVVAIRTHAVDELGNGYNQNNPLPTVPGGTQIKPSQFDKVQIVRDADDYPITYEFYLKGVLVKTIDVEYNNNKSAIIYQGSDPI